MNYEQEINKILNYIATNPNNQRNINSNIVEYLLHNHSDIIFIRGHLRKIKFKQITSNTYSIYTEAIL